jgi:hypothetical protein
MIEAEQVLVGLFWFAAYTVAVWLAGCLMGFGLGRWTARRNRRGSDVDELLKAQRARAQKAAPGASLGSVERAAAETRLG